MCTVVGALLVLLPLLSGAVASFHVACNASGAGGGAVAEPPLASAAGAGVDDLLLEGGASAGFTSCAAAACVSRVSVPAVLSLPTGFARFDSRPLGNVTTAKNAEKLESKINERKGAKVSVRRST